MQNQKLELTWIGKDKPIYPEPRILIHDATKDCGDPDTENMLIYGDNLLALKALEQEYTGKVKCIYIDPPYNTGRAFKYYDDNLAHSIWLALMKPRLEILQKLLADDGVIFVQIDDNEQAYLKVLMDEIFGRSNFINCISVNMSNMSGPKIQHAINGLRFPKIKEYLLVYSKSQTYLLKIPKIPKKVWDDEYNLIIENFTIDDKKQIDEFISKKDLKSLNEYIKQFSLSSRKKVERELPSGCDIDQWRNKNNFRIFASKPNNALSKKAFDMEFSQQLFFMTNPSGDIKLIRTDFNRNTESQRIELVSACEHQLVFLGDNWTDIVTTGGVAQEGGVQFPANKKPEMLIHRVIETASKLGDLVLDSFLGSGTTAAVAHKMGRRYIGIELGEHCHTLCIPRLTRVVKGEDQSGISKAVGWKGGGGFKYYYLAPSLLNKDKYGQYVISKEYNADMLAAAMAKLEGFLYSPDKDCYWKQGKSTENDYIFTTTTHINREFVSSISTELKKGESLLICCKSYDSKAADGFDGITIKKIPASVLGRCEFCKDNYNINIITPPEINIEETADQEEMA